ncbi:hypothetical protein LTR37_010212 [Vermiconidia calcicola]|uniref:Uncharacterized protein n=1 Tax=Vermiconidia calcicola TaxID=1690605 RepID=A0ACC3N5K2_9PEZI|nr:hypothetical protein LTR37_010212 [Vermiconidia calcicola]
MSYDTLHPWSSEDTAIRKAYTWSFFSDYSCRDHGRRGCWNCQFRYAPGRPLNVGDTGGDTVTEWIHITRQVLRNRHGVPQNNTIVQPTLFGGNNVSGSANDQSSVPLRTNPPTETHAPNAMVAAGTSNVDGTALLPTPLTIQVPAFCAQGDRAQKNVLHYVPHKLYNVWVCFGRAGDWFLLRVPNIRVSELLEDFSRVLRWQLTKVVQVLQTGIGGDQERDLTRLNLMVRDVVEESERNREVLKLAFLDA